MTPEEHWSLFLGIPSDRLRLSGVHVVPHAGLGDYWGAWIFYRDESVIVSVPESLTLEYRDRLLELAFENHDHIGNILEVFDSRKEKIVGPAFHGSLQAKDFVPCERPDVCEISFGDATKLSDTGDDVGWESSDSHEGKFYFVAFLDNQLVAMSNYRSVDGKIESPGIYTLPVYRGQGYAKKVLCASLEHGIKAGLTLMDYQTLCSNHGAIGAAESLGVRSFAKHVAIRFK
jgi:ribosomal protein S18 acetylase RimI-like enzyme